MSEIIPVSATPITPVAPVQAESDHQLIELWLHGRSRHTQRAYRADAERFMSFGNKSLHSVTLGDLQGFTDSLDSLEPATKHRKLAAIKSLFAFGHRLGYLTFDVARPLRLPALKDTLAERILSEAEVQRMLVLERQPRNHALICLLYASAIRVASCCDLRWRDAQGRTDGGQITVFGKGGKTNRILLPASVWSCLISLRGDADENAPIFRSRKGRHLDPSQVLRIVKAAAKRAGITKAVSPHWMRHAHASHALDRGAPISLVQTTLSHASISTTGKYLHARPTESSASFLPL